MMRDEAQQITEQKNRIHVPAVAGAALLTAINLLEFPTVLYVESEPEYGAAVSLTFAILGMLPLIFMESVPIARDSYEMFGNLQQSMHDLVDYIKAHPVISASIFTSAVMDSLPGMVDGSSLVKKWTDSDVAANVVMAVLAVGLNINYVFAYGKPTAEYLEQMLYSYHTSGFDCDSKEINHIEQSDLTNDPQENQRVLIFKALG